MYFKCVFDHAHGTQEMSKFINAKIWRIFFSEEFFHLKKTELYFDWKHVNMKYKYGIYFFNHVQILFSVSTYFCRCFLSKSIYIILNPLKSSKTIQWGDYELILYLFCTDQFSSHVLRHTLHRYVSMAEIYGFIE